MARLDGQMASLLCNCAGWNRKEELIAGQAPVFSKWWILGNWADVMCCMRSESGSV